MKHTISFTKILLAAAILFTIQNDSFAKHRKIIKHKKKTNGLEYQLGFKFSPLVSSMNPTKDRDMLPGVTTPMKLGATGGVVFNFILPYTKRGLSITTGILLTYKSYKIKVKQDVIDFKYNSFITPFEFPLIVSVSSPVTKYKAFREFVGLSLVYIGKFGQADVASFSKGDSKYTVSYRANYPREFGLQLVSGMAYTWILFGNKLVDMGFSYHYGLMSESLGEINYQVDKMNYRSEIVNRGSYLSFDISYYFSQKGSCPKFN